jgi:hypothetical protein
MSCIFCSFCLVYHFIQQRVSLYCVRVWTMSVFTDMPNDSTVRYVNFCTTTVFSFTCPAMNSSILITVVVYTPECIIIYEFSFFTLRSYCSLHCYANTIHY